MKVHGALRPFMHHLLQENPNTTTSQAVAALREHLADIDEGDRHLDEAADTGLATIWGDFTGDLRRKAQRLIKEAKAAIATGQLTLSVFETMKLSTPDGDESPTYADSTAIMLRKSADYIQKQVSGMEDQVTLSRNLATLLDYAEEVTNESNMTLRDAFGRGLITFAMVETAA